jgi:hypothetical protein
MFLLNILALIISVFFFLVFIIVHLVRKDMPLLKFAYSEYVFGRMGWVVKLALILIGINEIIIAMNFLLSGSNWSSLFMFLAAIGMLTLGIFDNHKPRNLITWIHSFGAAVQFLAFPIALLLTNTPFNDYKILNQIFGCVILFILVLMWACNFIYKDANKSALFQKPNIIVMNIWLFLTPLEYLLLS